jgi:glycosyltransferase involved in cell wall biosynthesis
LVVIEALACGLPVIATKGSSLTEVVDDGLTGVLCAQDEVSVFVQAVRELAASPDQLAAMSVAARQASRGRFDIDIMADNYVDVYRRVSAKSRWPA